MIRKPNIITRLNTDYDTDELGMGIKRIKRIKSNK